MGVSQPPTFTYQQVSRSLRCMGSSTIFGLELEFYQCLFFLLGKRSCMQIDQVMFYVTTTTHVLLSSDVVCVRDNLALNPVELAHFFWCGSSKSWRSLISIAYHFWRKFHITRVTSLVVPLRGHQHCQMIQWRGGLRWQGWYNMQPENHSPPWKGDLSSKPSFWISAVSFRGRILSMRTSYANWFDIASRSVSLLQTLLWTTKRFDRTRTIPTRHSAWCMLIVYPARIRWRC